MPPNKDPTGSVDKFLEEEEVWREKYYALCFYHRARENALHLLDYIRLAKGCLKRANSLRRIQNDPFTKR